MKWTASTILIDGNQELISTYAFTKTGMHFPAKFAHPWKCIFLYWDLKSGIKCKRCGFDNYGRDKFEGFDCIQSPVAKKDKNSCDQLAVDSKNQKISVSHQWKKELLWKQMVYVTQIKVGCFFPMVIWSEFRTWQYWDDHWEKAPYFIFPNEK